MSGAAAPLRGRDRGERHAAAEQIVEDLRRAHAEGHRTADPRRRSWRRDERFAFRTRAGDRGREGTRVLPTSSKKWPITNGHARRVRMKSHPNNKPIARFPANPPPSPAEVAGAQQLRACSDRRPTGSTSAGGGASPGRRGR